MKQKKKMTSSGFLLLITIVLFFVMYAAGMVIFADKGFAKPQMFLNLFVSNAGLLVISCGLTIVMITGGIDISVGSVTALVCMVMADLMENKGASAYVVDKGNYYELNVAVDKAGSAYTTVKLPKTPVVITEIEVMGQVVTEDNGKTYQVTDWSEPISYNFVLATKANADKWNKLDGAKKLKEGQALSTLSNGKSAGSYRTGCFGCKRILIQDGKFQAR